MLSIGARRCARLFSTGNSKLFVLEYHFVENMLEKRVPFRGAHLAYANKFVEEKTLIAGGALVPEVAKGVLLLRANNIDTVKAFANGDPYVTNGLVSKFNVSEWAVAVGGL